MSSPVPMWAGDSTIPEERLSRAKAMLLLVIAATSVAPLFFVTPEAGAPLLVNVYKYLAKTGAFGFLAAFMHIVPGSWSLTQVPMGAHPEHYAVYGQLIEAQEASPHMLPYFMLGLGMVVSVILLGIAHFRSRLPVRWAGPVLWAWVVVEFLGTGLFTWAPALSGALLVLGVGGLIAGLVREPARQPAFVSAQPAAEMN